jgi:tetratricopeptide (TPR) repeat protein
MPPTFEGAGLLPDAGVHVVYSESLYAHDAFRWAPLRSVRVGAFQYIAAPKPELYDLRHDPGELHNIAGENSQTARNLRGRLSSLVTQHATKGPATPADASVRTRRALESLGYIGRGSKTSGSGADPKERLAEYNLYEKALAQMYSGKQQGAIVTFKQVLARDPNNSLARYYLGDAYLRASQPDSAVQEWTNALQIDPQYVPAAEALGACWMGREDYSKARAAFQKALAIAPNDYAALLGLGMAEEHLGLLADALQHLESACRMADSASCQRELQAVKQKMQ